MKKIRLDTHFALIEHYMVSHSKIIQIEPTPIIGKSGEIWFICEVENEQWDEDAERD